MRALCTCRDLKCCIIGGSLLATVNNVANTYIKADNLTNFATINDKTGKPQEGATWALRGPSHEPPSQWPDDQTNNSNQLASGVRIVNQSDNPVFASSTSVPCCF